MPSIKVSDFGGSTEKKSIRFQWKALGLAAMIACALGWCVYQCVHIIFPKAEPVARVREGAGMPKGPNGEFQVILAKLDLTSDQKEKLTEIASETTNPVAFRRDALGLLTPQQREKVKNMREEIAAAAEQRKERNKARQAKYYPGNDLAVAKAGNQQIRERTEARHKAAEAAKQNPVTPTPGTGSN